eukprot:6812749-Prymnesium_polylepis.2
MRRHLRLLPGFSLASPRLQAQKSQVCDGGACQQYYMSQRCCINPADKPCFSADTEACVLVDKGADPLVCRCAYSSEL